MPIVVAIALFLITTVCWSSSLTLRNQVLSISRNCSDLFQLLSDINLVDDDGRSGLHHAVILGNIELVRLFLKHQANTMLKDKDGNLPLYYAEDLAYADVEKNRRDSPYFTITSLLLQQMTGVSGHRGEVTRDRKSWNALHWLVLAGDRAGVEELIDNGYDPTYGRHQTPIDVAFMLRDQEMFALLLTKGAETETLDLQRDSLSSIMRTMRIGSADRTNGSLEHWKTLINWITDAGLDPPLPHLLSPANIDDDDLVQLMHLALELGFDINASSLYGGQTILQQAISWHRLKTVRFLLEHGATIHRMSVIRSALSNYEAVAILLDYDFDINITDTQGFTPLMRAVQLGAVDTVRILKERGADTTLADNKGQIPLDFAKAELRHLTTKNIFEQRQEKLQKIIELLEEK